VQKSIRDVDETTFMIRLISCTERTRDYCCLSTITHSGSI